MFRYHNCLSFLPQKKSNQIKSKLKKKKSKREKRKEKRKIKKIKLKKKKKKKKKKKREREKEKERGDIHNQSINHWCLTHLSCISEALYG